MIPTSVIPDTNIFYHIIDGEMDIAQVVKPGETLHLSPVVVLEMAARLGAHGTAGVIRAAGLIQSLEPAILPHPESLLHQYVGGIHGPDKTDWMAIVSAMADPAFFNQSTRRLFFHWQCPGRNLRRTQPLDLSAATVWNARHEQWWVTSLLKLVDIWIPEFRTWYNLPGPKGKRPEINRRKKPVLREYLSSDECKQDIASILVGRAGVPPSPEATSLVNSSPLRCYVDTYVKYLEQLLLRTTGIDANDRWDSEFILYLNSENFVFATAERRWRNLTELAGYRGLVREVSVKSRTQATPPA